MLVRQEFVCQDEGGNANGHRGRVKFEISRAISVQYDGSDERPNFLREFDLQVTIRVGIVTRDCYQEDKIVEC